MNNKESLDIKQLDSSHEVSNEKDQENSSKLNLSEINMPPLRRDHSRSVDYTRFNMSQQQQKTNLDNEMIKEKGITGQNRKDTTYNSSSLCNSPKSVLQSDIVMATKERKDSTLTQSHANNMEQRRARRKQLNLRENLSPQQLLMNGEYGNGQGSEFDSKTTGRWSREEHEKFIEAMSLYGKDWKKVEQHIGTRSGAQIRSHAQKFFNRVEKELGADVDTYIQQKAQSINLKKDLDQENNDLSENNLESKEILDLDLPKATLTRDRSISHTFGLSHSSQKPKQKVDQIQKEELKGKDTNSKLKESQQQQKHTRPEKSEEVTQAPKIATMQAKPYKESTPFSTLQRVLFESINNYQSPEDKKSNPTPTQTTQPKTLVQKLQQIQKEKEFVQKQLLFQFQDALSSPQSIQNYIDSLKLLHQNLTQLYTDELKQRGGELLDQNTTQTILANLIEILNNIQLLSQIQQFVAVSITSNLIQNNQQYISPQRQNMIPAVRKSSFQDQINMSPQFQGLAAINNYSLSNNKNEGSNEKQGANNKEQMRPRKLSDWVDIGQQNEPNDEKSNRGSANKREKKQEEKEINQSARLLQSLAPNSAFTPAFASLAAGPFKPKDGTDFCLEGIKRLRGCSTSIESNNLNTTDKLSPNKEQQFLTNMMPLQVSQILQLLNGPKLQRERSLTLDH